MSYLVLARKWRPQRFDEIIGQGHITRVLTNAIKAGRIAHAYLFTGVRGVGKTTAARVLAKALNCAKGPVAVPCNECTHCMEINSGHSLDVYEIDGASNRGIDEVRQIIENARYGPAKGRFKIYIIDEVHQVTKDAFNALLKTLEEPPPFVKFILATTEPHRLPETILSRCQRLDFRRVPVRDMVQRLREIAQSENLPVTERALLLLAREAEGSMRDAESLLEQVFTYAGLSGVAEGATDEVDEQLLQDALGMARRETLCELSRAVFQGNAQKCLEVIGHSADVGLDMVRLSRELVEHFRNLLVVSLDRIQKGKERADSSLLSRLLDLPDQEAEELERQVAGLSPDSLTDYFEFMAKGDEEVARSAYPRFTLEATLVRLAILPASIPAVEIIERLEALERKLAGPRGVVAAAEPKAPPPPAPETATIQSQEKPAGDEQQGDAWQKFLAFVMQEKRFLALHLERARPLEMPPGPLRIGVEDRHHLSYLRDADNVSLLKDFARRFFSSDVPVTLVPLAPEERPQTPPETSVANPLSNEDALVKETLRIFGGSVKEIKRENG